MAADACSVSGRTAIVTGASRGIGRAVAERFASEGANVALCSRSEDRIGAVVDQINENEGGRAIGVACNVRDRPQIEAFVDAAVEEFGGIDTLVNNVGGLGGSPQEPLAKMDIEDWHAVLELNLMGHVNCILAALDHLRTAGNGSIVNVASETQTTPSPELSHYGAAKAAVVQLTKTLAYEFAADDIRVNCVSPGLIQTDGGGKLLGIAREEIPPRETVDRRIGYPVEVADVVRFLVSPAATFITGQTVPVKGVPISRGRLILDEQINLGIE